MTEPLADEPFSRIEPAEAKALMERGAQVVDVREPNEYAQVRIPGSILVPLGTLLRTPREFLKEGAVLFICSEGIRSAVACEAAAAIGLGEVYNLEGGIQRWETQEYPLESSPPEGEQGLEEVPTAAGTSPGAFLTASERLIRTHRFRYLRAVGCAWSTLDLLVEETLGEVQEPGKRCMARPDHPQQVPRPELTVYGESLEEALRALIDKLRGRRPQEVFLPTG
ncbi:MAG: rhodanese-like domain-containing protein [Candidatus Methylomirabilales bacterium]